MAEFHVFVRIDDEPAFLGTIEADDEEEAARIAEEDLKSNPETGDPSTWNVRAMRIGDEDA